MCYFGDTLRIVMQMGVVVLSLFSQARNVLVKGVLRMPDIDVVIKNSDLFTLLEYNFCCIFTSD